MRKIFRSNSDFIFLSLGCKTVLSDLRAPSIGADSKQRPSSTRTWYDFSVSLIYFSLIEDPTSPQRLSTWVVHVRGTNFVRPIVLFRNLWYTYPPRSIHCSIRVKSLRAKRAVLEKKKSTTKYEQYSKITY